MTKPKAKWIEDNRVLRQKNTYFTKEVPKLKGKLDKMALLLQEQEERHQKEMRDANHELLLATDLCDTLQQNFDVLAAHGVQQLVESVTNNE